MSLLDISYRIICILFSCWTVNASSSGCTGPTLLPKQPFTVIWNVPSDGCDAHGIPLNFSRYGILSNKDDKFRGDTMNLFYGFGDFPYISGKTLINGGIPQEGNLSLHLSKATHDIMSALPDVSFGGAGVIDFESWRPVFWTNYDSLSVYQTMSIDLVKRLHPSWTNETQIKAEAIAEFNQAARIFFQSSLQLAQKLRPMGHWGFYGFPACRAGYNPKTNLCNNEQSENDELSWLWQSSSGLYPRIYTSILSSLNSRAAEVEHVVNETIRMRAKYTSPSILILPYTLVQTGSTYFFDEADLDVTMKISGDMGSSGVVIWGGSSQFHEHGECILLQAYLDNVLGPYVMKLTDFYTSCSKSQCSGHGRCVDMKYELMYQKYLHQYGRQECRRSSSDLKEMEHKLRYRMKSNEEFDSNNYVCSCYFGWKGTKCDQKV